METNETRPCENCKGTGVYVSAAYTFQNVVTPERRYHCHACNGAKVFTAPDFAAIIEAITVTRKGQKSLRKSAPKHWGQTVTTEGTRAYYVWRMARFHGGADVCLPMTAEMMSRGDPFRRDLDTFAESIAKRVFGTDLAAAYRWGNALGMDLPVPASMPESARSGGPVADEGKPEWEQLELK